MAVEKLSSALDRFQEAHFWLHSMERFYHSADPFRWHLNAFLKAIKEVSDMISASLQNESGFSEWFRPHRQALKDDELLKSLAKHRDIIVHRQMLLPSSRADVGITKGRGLKFGLKFPANPLEDSDEAMRHYIWTVKCSPDDEMKDFLGVLSDDEDTLPCVRREWRIEGHDSEIIDLCADAWMKVGGKLSLVLQWLGADPAKFELDCRLSHQAVLFKLYDRAVLRQWIDEMPEPRPDQLIR